MMMIDIFELFSVIHRDPKIRGGRRGWEFELIAIGLCTSQNNIMMANVPISICMHSVLFVRETDGKGAHDGSGTYTMMILINQFHYFQTMLLCFVFVCVWSIEK